MYVVYFLHALSHLLWKFSSPCPTWQAYTRTWVRAIPDMAASLRRKLVRRNTDTEIRQSRQLETEA